MSPSEYPLGGLVSSFCPGPDRLLRRLRQLVLSLQECALGLLLCEGFTLFWPIVAFVFDEKGSYSINQAGFKLEVILLPQSPKY